MCIRDRIEGTQVLPGFALDSSPVAVIQSQADSASKLVQLNASASSDPNGLPLSYVWTNPTNNAAILNSTSATPMVELTSPGRYQFNATVTNSAGLSSTAAVVFSYVGR